MCVGAADTNPLCDECYAKYDACEGKDNFDWDSVCDGCKEYLTRYCWCCGKAYKTKEEGQIEEGACIKCREG